MRSARTDKDLKSNHIFKRTRRVLSNLETLLDQQETNQAIQAQLNELVYLLRVECVSQGYPGRATDEDKEARLGSILAILDDYIDRVRKDLRPEYRWYRYILN